jgi:Meiotically up-regulated gene 113
VSVTLSEKKHETVQGVGLCRSGSFQEDMGRSKQEVKYVYAVKSAAFPGLIKIGRTQNMKERLSQLNTSCAPSPFVIVVVSPTLDYVRDERLAHEFFSLQRKEGEFFSVPESEVIDYFKIIQEKFDVELSQPRVVDSTRTAQIQVLRRLMFGNLVKDEQPEETNDISGTSHEELEPLHHQAPVGSALDDFCRKRKRERDDLLFDMEMAERKTALEERKLALEEKRRLHACSLIEHTAVAMRAINDLKNWANVDECTKMQAKDYIKNILFNQMSVPDDGMSANSAPHE